MTTKTHNSVEVELPIQEVYDLWTNFEKFPDFMEGVSSVRVSGSDTMHWEASFFGVHREWDARVTENVVGRKIAWESTSGVDNKGAVSFEELSPNVTRVDLHLEFEPEGFVENVGDKLGFAASFAEGDLKRFRDYVEELKQVAQPPLLQEEVAVEGDQEAQEVGTLEDDSWATPAGEPVEPPVRAPHTDERLDHPRMEDLRPEETLTPEEPRIVGQDRPTRF